MVIIHLFEQEIEDICMRDSGIQADVSMELYHCIMEHLECIRWSVSQTFPGTFLRDNERLDLDSWTFVHYTKHHKNGQTSIPLAQLADGELHRYAATERGIEVRFWLYQKPDGKVATVFDACEICGPVGFYKGPNGVVCKNCAAPINGQSVGMAGGCNPIPLQATTTTDAVVVSEANIAAGTRYFIVCRLNSQG